MQAKSNQKANSLKLNLMENKMKGSKISFSNIHESTFAVVTLIFIFPTIKVISNVVDFQTNKLTKNLVFADYRDIYTVLIAFSIISVKTTNLILDC